MRGIAVVVTVLAAVPGCELVFPLDPPEQPPGDAAFDATPPVDAGPCRPFPLARWTGSPTGLVGTSPTVSSTGDMMIFAVDLNPGDNDQDLHEARFDGSFWTDDGQILVSSGRHDSPALDPGDDTTLLYSIGADGRVVRARYVGNTWTEDGPVIPGGLDDVQSGTMTDPIAGQRHIVIARRAGPDGEAAIDLFEFIGDGDAFAERIPSTTVAVNTAGVTDMDPYLSPDGCWLLFASNRVGPFDLYVATRPYPSAPFAAPLPLDLTDRASFVETDPWLSRDGTRLYFMRHVGMQDEIWVAGQ